jgi:hypothetical protein
MSFAKAMSHPRAFTRKFGFPVIEPKGTILVVPGSIPLGLDSVDMGRCWTLAEHKSVPLCWTEAPSSRIMFVWWDAVAGRNFRLPGRDYRWQPGADRTRTCSPLRPPVPQVLYLTRCHQGHRVRITGTVRSGDAAAIENSRQPGDRAYPKRVGRVAIIGDVGGFVEQLVACLECLGVTSSVWPDDLKVIQLGNLIGGNQDVRFCDVVELHLRAGRWTQLAGNWELEAVGGPAVSSAKRGSADPKAIARFRGWFDADLVSSRQRSRLVSDASPLSPTRGNEAVVAEALQQRDRPSAGRHDNQRSTTQIAVLRR